MAHQQAVAFHLPAAPQKVHSTWITPTFLAVLGRKEYLVIVDPRVTHDYHEVQREEMVLLTVVLQRCAIHAGASPNAFCRVVQEVHDYLDLMMEKKKACLRWRRRYGWGLGSTPWLPFPQKESLHQWPERRSLLPLLHLTLHPHLNQKGMYLLKTWPWCWGGGHCNPLVFSPRLGWPCNTTFGGCVQAGSYAHGNHDGPHCLGVTASGHLTYPSDWWGPLPPSGLKHHCEIHVSYFHLGTPWALFKDRGNLSDYNTPLHPRNTFSKHWPRWIPTLPMKWALDQVNTCSPNEVNFRSSEYPLSQWSEL